VERRAAAGLVHGPCSRRGFVGVAHAREALEHPGAVGADGGSRLDHGGGELDQVQASWPLGGGHPHSAEAATAVVFHRNHDRDLTAGGTEPAGGNTANKVSSTSLVDHTSRQWASGVVRECGDHLACVAQHGNYCWHLGFEHQRDGLDLGPDQGAGGLAKIVRILQAAGLISDGVHTDDDE
jgi:hypothetical protein